LALTRATPMRGTIALRVDRDPDFFRLLRLRGETKVLVATSDGELAACASGTTTTAFIGRRPEKVGYAGDLKVHPRFAGNRLVPRLIGEVVEHLQSQGVDLILSLVAEGNRRVMGFFG